MADRFPLILNTSINQIQEIASGDQLDLTGNNIANAGIITAGNVTIGAATTDLIVSGDARITGILTVGTGSLTLDGPNNLVNVGTALTLGHTQGLQFHTQNLHSAGFEVNQINASGIITATGAVVNGDIDVDGHTNLDNVSVAGVSTFTGNADFSAGVDVTGDINVTSTLPVINLIDSNNNDDFAIKNVDGVFTIRDATNGADRLTINSSGKATFTTGLDITSDLTIESSLPQIFLNDTDNNDDFVIRNNNGVFTVRDSTNGTDRFTINSSGVVNIPGNTDFGAGIDVTGNATVSGNLSVGGVLTYEDVTNVDSVGIITARNGLKVTGGTSHFVGVANFNETIVGTARTAIKLTCTDESTDTTTYPLFVAATTGDQFPKTGTNLSFNSASGALSATSFVGGGTGLTSLSGSVIASALSGQDISGLGNIGINATLTARQGVFTDDGSGSPTVSISTDDGSPWALQIKNDTYWNNASNGLKIYQNNSGDVYSTVQGNGAFVNWYFQTNSSGTNNNAIHIDTNRAVHLKYQNNQRLATINSGVSVSGDLGVGDASNPTHQYDQGIHVHANGTGAVLHLTDSSSGSGTGDGFDIISHASTAYLWQRENSNMVFGTQGISRWNIYGSNGHFAPSANNTYDIGTDSMRVRNIYTNDLNLSNEGSANDVDGTWGNYTIQEGESDLFLINKRSGKKYKFNLTEVS